MSKAKVLISGGAGFIGSRLALELIDNGYEVTVIDNLSEQIHGNNPEDSMLFKSIVGKVSFMKGDVRIKEDIERSLGENDYVFHLAAETGTGQSMYRIADYSEVNIQGTANLLQCICESDSRIRKVILASSRAIYGEGSYSCEECGDVTPRSRHEEDMKSGQWAMFCPQCNGRITPVPTSEDAPQDPQSIYAVTKYAQELLVKRVCSVYGIPFVILRYQNVYGPSQSMRNPYTGVLGVFSTQILNGKNPEIFEDGQESRDFVYIDDVTWANVRAIETDACNNRTINIGSGCPITIKAAADLLIKESGASVRPVINGKFRVGDIYSCHADISRATELLGFRPTMSFVEGIKEFAAWAKEQPNEIQLFKGSVEEMARKGLYK